MTHRTAWNWGVKMGHVTGRFPNSGLRFPRSDEKPPFQTREEILKKIVRPITAAETAELWDALYLTLREIEKLLIHVRSAAAHPWIYPMVATVAHTGARRSELLRMQVTDVDFSGATVIIREKKSKHGVNSARRVPPSPFLAIVLREWIDEHAGGTSLLYHGMTVERSKKRSLTMGYKGQKTRATTKKGRGQGITQRKSRSFEPLTKDEAHDHLKRTLAGSDCVMRGWHVLRHSFISACASKGIDQRMLQAWCGHTTAEMSAWYTHLYPSAQREAIASVFDRQ